MKSNRIRTAVELFAAACLAASCGDAFTADLFPDDGGGGGVASAGGGVASAGGDTGGSPSTAAHGGAGAFGGDVGAGGAGASGGGAGGSGGAYNGPPSCAALGPDCAGEDCCGVALVVGGTYDRGNDPQFPAVVSTFELETFEVTVGRFRAFVADYPYAPAPGDGAHPSAGGGWSAAWADELPATQNDLVGELKCNGGGGTWTDSPTGFDSRPITCVSWYVGFAFCAWDGGGRLPTEAEWNYAAAGGDEQRLYPWGGAPPTTAHAAHECMGDGVAGCALPADHVPVGSFPLGAGRWGHSDLAGNAWEWTRDVRGEYPLPCADCIQLAPDTELRLRGGGYNAAAVALETGFRRSAAPETPSSNQGLRCAR